MRVSVVGTGYVGLVTGVCLADRGHTVVCVDQDAEKIRQIEAGRAPIHEEGLDSLLRRHIGERLKATADLERAVLDTEITLIAVGTPFDGERIDLAHVRRAAREIGEALRLKIDYHVVVVKSTVVPGTTDNAVTPELERGSGKRAGEDFGVGNNPEFLTEGQAVRDFLEPDRIVIGGADARARETLSGLYHAFEGVKKILTNNKTAEMIKYASNAMLATMISFSNELADLCESVGEIDALEVMRGVHLSHYFTDVGGRRWQAPITAFLEAGCGFGGSCLPKDVKALISHGESLGTNMPLLRAVMEINGHRPGRMIGKLEGRVATLKGLRVAVLGLAFKPDTDDVRESPAFPILRALLDREAIVRAYDPVATEAARKAFPADGVHYADSLENAVADAEAILVVTRWAEFERLPEIVSDRDPPPLVVDGRRMLDPGHLDRYAGIGIVTQE
jgi:UDPglucose 6-dehydrogenase/GDP-mannose 6-dehydrogenase